MPINRPQQQAQQNQPQQRPPRPQNNQAQQNAIAPNNQAPPGWFYPFYPMMPVMQHSGIPNQQQPQANSNSGNSNNAQLQHAIQNMMNRNSFLGFVDPLIIVAVIAIPVIAMLGFSSVVMPFIPVIIYILNIFFPLNAASGRRRKKRSISLDRFCPLLNDLTADFNDNDHDVLLGPDLQNHHHLLYATRFHELQLYLKQFHRSICFIN